MAAIRLNVETHVRIAAADKDYDCDHDSDTNTANNTTNALNTNIIIETNVCMLATGVDSRQPQP